MVKTFMDEVIDAINKITTSEATKTRALITEENKKTNSKLKNLETHLKIILTHQELTTDETIKEDEVS